MSQAEQTLVTYLRLAQASVERRQPLVRDKLLVLAAVSAAELGWEDVAADCRSAVLRHNPRHMIRRWKTLEVAADSQRFQSYLKQLRRKYAPERAEYMLGSLGVALPRVADDTWQLRGQAVALAEQILADTADRSISQSKTPSTSKTKSVAGAPAWSELGRPYFLALAVLALLVVLRLVWP